VSNADYLPITRPRFDEGELKLLSEVLESGWVTQGPVTSRFEQGMAERHDVPHALATTSCTAALHLAMLALDLGPGDEVVVPAFTWVTSAYSALYVGADVVFADVDPGTFNLDPSAFEAAITPATRAVVVVHLFGQSAVMDEVLSIAQRHDLRVIEDAACAVGTTWEGRPVGGLGAFGCFSFHPRKVITTGEGGMVTTRDDDLAVRIRSLRNHGASGSPVVSSAPMKPHEMGAFDNIGFNLRLSDIQAAVGVAQLEKLDDLLAHRIGCAVQYDELLAGIDGLATPVVAPGAGHTYQSYVLRVVEGGRERRNRVMEALEAEGIQTRPGTHAVHRLGYFARQGVAPDAFPNACQAEETSITLPIFPGMTESDQERVAEAIRRHF